MEAIIAIRCNKDLKKSLEKLALKDRRKLSDYVRLQLEKIVELNESKK